VTLLTGKRYLLCYIVLSYQSSVVSDLEEGDQTERLMSLLFIVMALSPNSKAHICVVPYIW
jgi:hypothetical protein